MTLYKRMDNLLVSKWNALSDFITDRDIFCKSRDIGTSAADSSLVQKKRSLFAMHKDSILKWKDLISTTDSNLTNPDFQHDFVGELLKYLTIANIINFSQVSKLTYCLAHMNAEFNTFIDASIDLRLSVIPTLRQTVAQSIHKLVSSYSTLPLSQANKEMSGIHFHISYAVNSFKDKDNNNLHLQSSNLSDDLPMPLKYIYLVAVYSALGSALAFSLIFLSLCSDPVDSIINIPNFCSDYVLRYFGLCIIAPILLASGTLALGIEFIYRKKG